MQRYVWLVLKLFCYIAEEANGKEIGWGSDILNIEGVYEYEFVAKLEADKLNAQLEDWQKYDESEPEYFVYKVEKRRVE